MMEVVTRESMKDIVDTASAAGKFEALVNAVEVAGLLESLKGAGPLTLFAPTDEAFAEFPEGTMEALLRDPRRLEKVLSCHLVKGELLAEDIGNFKHLDTLHGNRLTVSVQDGLEINGAKVLMGDILTSNGIIHVIDAVILP
jgi:uncharacterized surface protein with fasciclin (FAS1) repeats